MRARITVRQLYPSTLFIAICLGVATISTAQQPATVDTCIYPYQALTCPTALLRGCCDDYCRKSMPCITDFCAAQCPNDYCRKPFPCIPCYPGACDPGCYCRKPWPDLCRPLAADYFTCCGWNANCGVPATPQTNYVVPHASSAPTGSYLKTTSAGGDFSTPGSLP
jgi:hypothetical protein